jgi:integrin-linked kinase-associated serine/threonine phosphatase 2C
MAQYNYLCSLEKSEFHVVSHFGFGQAGGVVTDGRLQGRIEVSRSFGDRAFKKVGMSAVPELRSFQLGQTDRFLLMGCDGFWGVSLSQ